MFERIKGLDPIVGDDPRILILGTFPGDSSWRAKKYYEDNRNRFWGIMNRVLNDNQGFLSYAAKTKCLKDHHIAVWDVYETKLNTGESSNKGILAPSFNDLGKFLSEHPTIQRIVFNGKDEPAYQIAIGMFDIPREMCVFLQQTSGSACKRVVDYLDSWGEALTK